IVWLDRRLLSAGEDQTLHRSPRCAGLRYVHYRWELFSRDPTHLVYVAPYPGGSSLTRETVEAAATYVLPLATAQHETLPVRLAAARAVAPRGGGWVGGGGEWGGGPAHHRPEGRRAPGARRGRENPPPAPRPPLRAHGPPPRRDPAAARRGGGRPGLFRAQRP